MLRGHTYSDGQALEQECQMMAFCLPESRVAHHKKNASNMTCQTSAIWGTPYQITWCSEWAGFHVFGFLQHRSSFNLFFACQL
eukprot:scaffold199570_cov15-Tisochrysis_lutea.AAC.2